MNEAAFDLDDPGSRKTGCAQPVAGFQVHSALRIISPFQKLLPIALSNKVDVRPHPQRPRLCEKYGSDGQMQDALLELVNLNIVIDFGFHFRSVVSFMVDGLSKIIFQKLA